MAARSYQRRQMERRQSGTKSNVIIGSIVSAVAVAVLTALIILLVRGQPDLPTSATSAARLQRLSVPDFIPRDLYQSTEDTNAANFYYEQAIQFAMDNRARLQTNQLQGKQPDPELSRRIAEMLTEGMKCQRVHKPILDQRLPIVPNPMPDYGDALDLVTDAATFHGRELLRQGRRPDADTVGRAIFALGRRLFESDERYWHRVFGFQTMIEGLLLLYQSAEPGSPEEKRFKKIHDDMYEIWRDWNAKVGVIKAMRPNYGDLIRIARHDQDVGWRIEATLQLGIAKFGVGRGRANDRAIQQAIRELQSDPDPRVAQAAKVAEAFTVEDVRRQ
jgi:hypothetical protein